MNDPNMGHWTYAYDPNNNLISQTDAKNQTISFTYDALKRLTRKTYPDQTHIDYVYDACPPATCGGLSGENYPIGKLLKVQDFSGIQTFRYDKLGRVIQDRKSLDDGHDYSFLRVYDGLGRVRALEYPDQDVLTLTFNPMGTAETLTLFNPQKQPAPIIQDVDYNAAGEITRIVYGNGVISDYTYNPQTFRLEHLLTHNASQTLQDMNYQFDSVGNVLSITDAIHSNTQSFLYDELDRLIQATGSYGSHLFAYNPIGNMTQKANATLSYNDPSHPHAVTHYESPTESIDYAYDLNGNMTHRGNETLTYN